MGSVADLEPWNANVSDSIYANALSLLSYQASFHQGWAWLSVKGLPGHKVPPLRPKQWL